MREELRRLNAILEADKEEMNEESKRAALRDFQRIAQEYFDLDGELSLKTERVKQGMQVSLTFRAVRIKNFTALK
ncbi:MAG: hypothetical protein HFE25_06440 [Clostridia bacterium]|jgi:hypothetical protein|nr:hypothetical protein [Clostridia bacterium]